MMPTDSQMGFYGNGLEADADNVLVYPANTHVRIVGNKRTKASLMGQEGIVIKTVGLGGWHWLQLKNGTTVKVQRNALCLAEDDLCDGCYEEDSTPSERSSTHGCPELNLYKIRTSGGINLHKLSTQALLRYASMHGLQVGPRMSRAALLKQVWWHFECSAMDEYSVFASLSGRHH